MIQLYRAEWCPHSHRVRQRLSKVFSVIAALDRRFPEPPAAACQRQRASQGWPEWLRLASGG